MLYDIRHGDFALVIRDCDIGVRISPCPLVQRTNNLAISFILFLLGVQKLRMLQFPCRYRLMTHAEVIGSIPVGSTKPIKRLRLPKSPKVKLGWSSTRMFWLTHLFLVDYNTLTIKSRGLCLTLHPTLRVKWYPIPEVIPHVDGPGYSQAEDGIDNRDTFGYLFVL